MSTSPEVRMTSSLSGKMICGCTHPEPKTILVHWNEEMEQYAPPKRPYVGQIPITDKKRGRKLQSIPGVGVGRCSEFSEAVRRSYQLSLGVTPDRVDEVLTIRCEHQRQADELDSAIQLAERAYETQVR